MTNLSGRCAERARAVLRHRPPTGGPRPPTEAIKLALLSCAVPVEMARVALAAMAKATPAAPIPRPWGGPRLARARSGSWLLARVASEFRARPDDARARGLRRLGFGSFAVEARRALYLRAARAARPHVNAPPPRSTFRRGRPERERSPPINLHFSGGHFSGFVLCSLTQLDALAVMTLAVPGYAVKVRIEPFRTGQVSLD